MTVSTLTLSALLDKARRDEERCWNELRHTEPNTPGHVQWHGHWEYHRGQRVLLELLLGDGKPAARTAVAV